MTLWTVGNTAKLHTLNRIAEAASQTTECLTIIDLGCGEGKNFIRLMQHFPHLHYVGIEPSTADCAAARANLPVDRTTIIQGYAYEGIRHQLPQPHYDFVVSFSVLEHVYRREDYFRFIAACLKPNGRAFINYDAGHFVQPTLRERLKNIVGPILARLGDESRYQAFVHEADVQRWIRAAGLTIVDNAMFNTRLKGVYKTLPEAQRAAFMPRWLELELWLNQCGLAYSDQLAHTWFTRYFELALA
jgi:2-polyprenyl-3-methyl-5-hydroxy-6-metoxy-1,4-benzoquinol methylase